MNLNQTLALVHSFNVDTSLHKLQCKICNRVVVMYKRGEKNGDIVREQVQLHMTNYPACIVPNLNAQDLYTEEPL